MQWLGQSWQGLYLNHEPEQVIHYHCCISERSNTGCCIRDEQTRFDLRSGDRVGYSFSGAVYSQEIRNAHSNVEGTDRTERNNG